MSYETPYLGLESYSEDDASRFFGRDAERADLLRCVERGRLTVICGRSGLGKTSLLRAGLFPALRELGYFPVYLRLDFRSSRPGTRGPSPLSQLASRIKEEIAARGLLASPPGAQETLWEYFRRPPLWAPPHRLLRPVLVFDQFEEFFGDARREATNREFFEQLCDLVEDRLPPSVLARWEAEGRDVPSARPPSPVHVVLSLREDFLAHLESESERCPSLAGNRFRLLPLGGGQARLAVLGPARARGLDIVDDAAADALVRSAAGSSTVAASAVLDAEELSSLQVEPVLLSLLCAELDQRREESGAKRIRITDVYRHGEDVFREFYEESLRRIGKEFGPRAARGAARLVEDRLLTPSGARTPLDAELARAELRGSEAVLRSLVDRHLVRCEPWNGREHVELIHDRLCETVAGRRDLRREGDAARRRFVTGMLLVAGITVASGLAWYFRTLQTSAEAAEQRARRHADEANGALRDKTATSLALELKKRDLELALLDLKSTQENLREEHRTTLGLLEARERLLGHTRFAGLVGTAAAVEESDPGLALLLATEALQLALVPESGVDPESALSRLHGLLRNSHELAMYRAGEAPILECELCPWDPSSFVTGDNAGHAILWRMNGTRVDLPRHATSIRCIDFAPAARRILVASADGTATVCDAEGRQVYATPMRGAYDMYEAGISPDGTRVFTLGMEPPVEAPDSVGVVSLEPVPPPRIRLWAVGAAEPVASKVLAINDVAAFGPDGAVRILRRDSRETALYAWDGGEMVRPRLRLDPIAASLAPSGDRVLTYAGESIRVWDDLSARVADYVSPGRLAYAGFSRDPDTIILEMNDGLLTLWGNGRDFILRDLRGMGNAIDTVSTGSGDKARTAFLKDGRIFLRQGDRGAWERTLEGHSGPATRLLLTKDGSRLISTGADGTVRIWALAVSEAGFLEAPEMLDNGSVAISPRADWAVLTGGAVAAVWDRARGALRPLPDASRVVVAVVDPMGPRFLTGHADGRLVLWDADTLAPEPLAPPGARLRSARFIGGGTAILVERSDGGVEILDRRGGTTAVLQRPGSASRIHAVASPDGERFLLRSDPQGLIPGPAREEAGSPAVAAPGHREAWLVDRSGGLVKEVQGHELSLRAAVFSPDGREVLTVSADAVQQWTRDGVHRMGYLDRERRIEGAFFGAAGVRILVVREGAWELRSIEGSLLRRLPAPPDFRLATAGETQIKDASPRPCMPAIDRPGSIGAGGDVSADGTMFLVNRGRNTIVVYDSDGRLLFALPQGPSHERACGDTPVWGTFVGDSDLVATVQRGRLDFWFVGAEAVLRAAKARASRAYVGWERDMFSELLGPPGPPGAVLPMQR